MKHARLDENTRQIIEHGRRIRACLDQAEFAPVSVPAQIAILLALTEKLFDSVPLEQMTQAEQALREATANIPAEVCARFETADQLSAADRKAVVNIAREALARFQPRQEAKPEPESETKAKPEPDAEAEPAAPTRS